MLLDFDFTSVYAVLIYVGALVFAGVLSAVGTDLFGSSKKLWRRRGQASERAQEHDRRMVREIREALPREIVNEFLRDHDFGASWRAEWMYPVWELARRNNVEDRFSDHELETLRAALHEAISTLGFLFGSDSSPSTGHGEFQDVGIRPRRPGDPETRLFNERRQRLNDAATRAADAYDALVEAAREKLLL